MLYFSACGTRSGIFCYIFSASGTRSGEHALVFCVVFSACGTRSDILRCIFLCVDCALIFCVVFFCMWNALLYFLLYIFCVWNSLWYFMFYFPACVMLSGILCYIFLHVERALIFCVIYFTDFLFILCCIILTLISFNFYFPLV